MKDWLRTFRIPSSLASSSSPPSRKECRYKRSLRKVIRATGVKEFALRVGMPSPNLLRCDRFETQPHAGKLERLLKPFGFRIGLAQLKRRKKRAA